MKPPRHRRYERTNRHYAARKHPPKCYAALSAPTLIKLSGGGRRTQTAGSSSSRSVGRDPCGFGRTDETPSTTRPVHRPLRNHYQASVALSLSLVVVVVVARQIRTCAGGQRNRHTKGTARAFVRHKRRNRRTCAAAAAAVARRADCGPERLRRNNTPTQDLYKRRSDNATRFDFSHFFCRANTPVYLESANAAAVGSTNRQWQYTPIN